MYDDEAHGGVPTVLKKNDTIAHNFMLANYHSSMAIDNDDGSAFYDTHHNVFVSASRSTLPHLAATRPHIAATRPHIV